MTSCGGRLGGLVSRCARARVVLFWPTYWLSGLAPRDPRLWAFGSQQGRTFNDNAKWLFLACARDSRIRPVWLTRSAELASRLRAEGFEAHHIATLRGLVSALRAGVHLYDSGPDALNPWLARKALLVNLWHGIPLKRIEADVPRSSPSFRYHERWSARGVFQRLFRPYRVLAHDFIVATSDRVGELLASAFQMSTSQVLVTGYPRNDPLADVELRARRDDELGIDLGSFSRVVGYFPTFRENAGADAVRFDWVALDAALRARGALLLIKLHPDDRRRIEAPGMQNVRVLPPPVDPYALLPRLDALVTDYSSIFFDYLLLDRPLLFFPYDLEHYRRDERGFYFEYDEVTPGPKARTFEQFQAELCELLDGYDRATDGWRERRRRVTQLCHRYQDAGSSLRLIDELLRRTGPDRVVTAPPPAIRSRPVERRGGPSAGRAPTP